MAIKKNEIYSSLWASCDKLRGGMDASQYKDYILTLLFVKYVTDKFKGVKYADITVPEGGSFDDMVALKGTKNIGEGMDKVIGKLAEARDNQLRGVIDNAHFNDEAKLGKGQEMVDKLTGLISIFQRPEFDFRTNKAGGDDILGDAYEYLSRATARHNDTHGYCLFMLGIAANKIGLGAEALSYLDEAKKLMVPDRKTLFRLHQELAESFRMKGEPDFRLQELEECMRYAEEKDVNTLTYQMGKCYLQLRQFDKARETLSRFLDATKDKEYNHTIKSMRQSAEESLRMMMW